MATINQLLSKIRVKLRDQYKDIGSIASAIASGSTKLRLTEGISLGDGDFLEIDSEVLKIEEGEKLEDYLSHASDLNTAVSMIHVDTSADFVANDYIRIDNEYMKVTKVSAFAGSVNLRVARGERGTEAANHYKKSPIYMKTQARVRRGQLGSTAASHSNAAALYLADGWTDHELKEHLKDSIRALRPLFYRDYVGNVRGVGNRRQLDDMDATTGWAASVSGTAVGVDTSDKVEGDASFKMGSAGAAAGVYTKTITSFDFADYEYLNFFAKIAALIDADDDPYLDEEAITIRLGNDTAIYHQFKIHRNELLDGQWFPISLHRSQASAIGSIADASIDTLQFRINAAQAIAGGDILIDDVFVSKFPISSNKRIYPLPRNVYGVNEVVGVDSEGNQKQLFTAWRVEGDASQANLVFDHDIPWNRLLEIKGRQLIKVPSANTDEILMDDTEEEAIVLKAGLMALDKLMNDRIRFDRYSAKLASKEFTVLDIFRAKSSMQTDLDRLVSQFGNPVGAVDLDWTDNKPTNAGGGTEVSPFS